MLNTGPPIGATNGM